MTPPFSTQGEIKSVGTRTPKRSNLKPSVSFPSGLGTTFTHVSFNKHVSDHNIDTYYPSKE